MVTGLVVENSSCFCNAFIANCDCVRLWPVYKTLFLHFPEESEVRDSNPNWDIDYPDSSFFITV